MKTNTLLLSAVVGVALTSCDAVTLDDFRAASPSSQGIELKMSKGSGSQLSSTGETRQGLVGEPALMPGVTALATGVVNGGVGLTLGTVAAIVASEPTKQSQREVVWGPMTKPLWADEFRMTMTYELGVFHYVVDRRPKNSTSEADYVVVLDGSHERKIDAGEGTFTLHFQPKQQPADVANVKYTRSTSDDVTVEVQFRGGKLESDYRFAQKQGGEGFFEFGFDADVDKQTAALEHLQVNSRWKWNGEGRSDVTMTKGDVTSEVRFSECWNQALLRSYYADTVGLFATEGEESACTFATAQFSVLP